MTLPDFSTLIRIANVRTYRPVKGEAAVYVGRGRAPEGAEPGGLGNPFRVGAEYAQGEAADAFLPYLRNEYRAGGAIRARLVQLAERLLRGERIVLLCWCNPKPCHANHILTAVIGIARQLQAERTRSGQAG